MKNTITDIDGKSLLFAKKLWRRYRGQTNARHSRISMR